MQENKILAYWLQFFFNQRGEVGEPDAGDENPDGDSDNNEISQDKGKKGDETPEFAKPISNLPDELKSEWEKHRRGMQRSYTKVLEKLRAKEAELNERAQKYENVDKFYSDADFANQIVEEWAKQNGVSLVRGGKSGDSTKVSPDVPKHLLEAAEASLPPELKWMAPHLAKFQWTAMAPIEKEKEQKALKEREKEVDSILEELSADNPGWEEHEDDLMELLEFMRSDNLTHKRFGSKPKLLLGLLTGNANAIKEATNRMRQALKHKATTPAAGTGMSNIFDRVRKAKSTNDAWAEAKKAALNEHGAGE